jgi:NADH dehydrogenase/NADH:ubiquinone oxidoreductase subunit G
MSKLKEQAPAIVVTALVMGALLGGYAYYVNAKVLPAQRRAMDEMRFAHEAALERSAAETRKEIAAVNQLLKDTIATRSGGAFQNEEEAKAAEAAQVAKLAEAVAQRLQPYNPLPRTPEEAEQMQNAQIDKVSGRLSERIQPILTQIAGDQNLTRDSLNRYADQISQQITGVLTGELARNERLGTQVQLTQSLAQESIALSSELTALYLSSIKDQGVINRLLLLPANIVRDASRFQLLNNDERRAKESDLTKRLRDLQGRLDAARSDTDSTVGNTPDQPAEGSAGGIVVEPAGGTSGTSLTAAPIRQAPTRPSTTR